MRCWRTLFLSPPSAPSHTPFSWTCWIFWRATPTTCFLKSKSSRRIFRFSMRLGAVSLFKQKNIFYTMGLSKAKQYNCLINIIYNMRKNDTDMYMTSSFTNFLLYIYDYITYDWRFLFEHMYFIKENYNADTERKANLLRTNNYCTKYLSDGPRLLPDESL